MKFALLALATIASAAPLIEHQETDVSVSDLQKFKDADNSLPDSGTYRLDIVPGRKEGESS